MPLHRFQGPEENNIPSLSGNRLFSLIEHGVDVEVVPRDIQICPFLDSLRPLMVGITPEQVGEVEKTIHYLYTKFQPIYEALQTELSISPEYFLEGLVTRLIQQIQTANNTPGKKFYNSDVSSLKRMSADKDGGITMELENIPYWSFACTGVSLDAIHFDTSKGNKSLRDVLDVVSKDGKNTAGEYALPNSLGVSVMIQLADGTIIGQQRNNATTLTQYHGLMSSASGAMIPLPIGSHKLSALRTGAATEMREELDITSEHLSHLPDITDMAVSMQQHILRELGISNTSFAALAPLGIVVEGKRKNPEVVFTLVLPPSVTFEDVHKKWLAQDKDESRGLIAVKPEQVQKQLDCYAQHMSQELRDSPTGLEEFIKKHPHCADWVGSHFLMSYLAWKKSVENKTEKFRSRIFELLPPPRLFTPSVDKLEFPGSSVKPSEDSILISETTGVYGVFDGATGLSSPPNMTTTGGRIASQTVARVLAETPGSIFSALENANTVLEYVHGEQGVDVSKTVDRFMTSASVVQQVSGGLEYVSAGDSTIVVEYENGELQVITEEVDHDENALRLWAELVQEKGPEATYNDIRFDDRMKKILIQGREQANLPGGKYGVLAGTYLPGSALQKGFIPYNKNGGIKRVILFTDGFEIPTKEPWNKDEKYYREWLQEFDKLGAEGLQKKIGQIAQDDPDCLQYPRFKPLDDGSIVELNFAKTYPIFGTHGDVPGLRQAA